MPTPDAERFLEQNDDFTPGLTPDDLATLDLYAEHHAGGLYVLWRDLGNGVAVKAHDDWGGDGGPVVHVYDLEDPDRDNVLTFDTGHDALRAFLMVTADDVDDTEGWNAYRETTD